MMGGAQPDEELPSEDKSLLKERGDVHGLAAAYLSWDKPLEALGQLDQLGSSSHDVRSDRAAAFLLLGRHEEARDRQKEALSRYEEVLGLLDPLLEANPNHLQARWNRALVLEALKLPLLAARDFQAVASQEWNKDWAKEASENAARLIAESNTVNAQWQALRDVGEELVATGRPPEGVSELSSPIMRLYFYEAVRTRTSSDAVLALRPLAKQLDAEAGGEVLQRYVERVARRDFTIRAPLSRDYVQLRKAPEEEPHASAILARLLRSSEDDLILGALGHTKAGLQHLEEFEARTRASQDPWFEILTAQLRAEGLIRRGDFWSAEAKLKSARQLCESARVAYRCVDLEVDLANLYAQLLLPDEVRAHAQEGWAISRQYSLRGKEIQLIQLMATAARLSDSVLLARAYLKETLESARGRDGPQERYIHENLALLEIHALNFDRARAEIDQALALKIGLTLDGAAALSDIARQRPAPGDEEAMNRVLSEAGPPGQGKHALALHHLGRFYLPRERVKGQGLLRDAIREAEASGERDEYSRHARTYSYTALILDVAQARDFEAALKLVGEELGLEVPGRCVLAITVDSERSLVLARGADGVLRADYDGARTELLPRELTDLVSREAQAALRPCEKVEVLARPPLQGRSGLLPRSFTWSFRTRREAPRLVQGKAVHLVVMDVEYNSERKLERLRWEPSFGPTEQRSVLSGPRATPRQVLREMENATEIDLVTHGLVSPISDAAYLVLAKERRAGETDELWAHQLRKAKLKGAPLVVLAACHAGRAAPVLHEAVSLPNALIEAGARAVLAATRPIPDKEASDFFNAVRARIRQGASPAAALRAERMAWFEQKRGQDWPDSVLLFE